MKLTRIECKIETVFRQQYAQSNSLVSNRKKVIDWVLQSLPWASIFITNLDDGIQKTILALKMILGSHVWQRCWRTRIQTNMGMGKEIWKKTEAIQLQTMKDGTSE